ncbi:MAG TPA: flagellar M-ring protein FliF C-terminal domain-containing protein, partial [Candidatus Brocadiia bacterium]|nr:flagellar M-ring protein FliF C-terminal domain-containing protein [Candidatus Brocadiia bacterium]
YASLREENIRIVQETNEIDPDSKVAVHESVKNKSSSPGAGGKAASITADESSEVTYQFGRRISKTRRLPGAIKRLSIAAQIDPYFTGPDGKEAELSEKEIEDIAESIKNAVGFTAAAPRNDTFQLTRIRFHRAPAGTAFGPAGEATAPPYVLILRFASAPIALIIAFLFARMFMRRSRPVSRPVAVQTADGATVVLPAEYGKEGEAKTAQEEAERQQKIELRRRVAAALKKDPAGAARLLQMWLRAEK